MTVALHAVVDGPDDAPVLLLGSSLGTTGRMWDPQVPALAERFRVVRFDHRGHGGSPVPSGPYAIEELGADVVALLDRLDVSRCSYAGLSLGAMVGMWLAANAPERLERLALLCTSAQLGPATGWHDRAAAVRAGGTSSVAVPVVERWFTPGFAREHPDVVATQRERLSAVPAEGYAGCCEAIAAMDLRALLPSVTAPTLVVAGADDRATPVEHARVIVDAVPGARLEILPDAAHLASVQHPAAVTALLLAHLTDEDEGVDRGRP